MKKKKQIADLVTIGFALFAMFFGAGNLIFPPHLGVSTGSSWLLGFLFFFIADFGLGILGVLGMSRLDGRVDRIAEPLGRIPAVLLATAIIVCIGPGLAIPRTAATTYELALVPLLRIEGSPLILALFSVLFFGIVLFLSRMPGKVVDIIGKILTPVLLVALAVMIVEGFVYPGADIGAPVTENVVREGLTNGYQTLDMLAAVLFTVLLITSIRGKGYEDRRIAGVSLRSSLVAALLLFLVYGGLTFLGATTGTLWTEQVMSGQMNQAQLTVAITGKILGPAGTAVLAVVVFFACLTTAIGLVSATAEYFERLTSGKLSYKKSVVIICILSAFVCNLGLSDIISITAPILMLLYPVTIVMLVLVLVRDKVKSVVPYRTAAAVTLGVSILDLVGNTLGVAGFAAVYQALPLSDLGFAWLIPAIVAFLIGLLFKGRKAEKDMCREMRMQHI